MTLAAALVLVAGCGKPGVSQQINYGLDDPRMMPITEPPSPAEGERIASWATAPWPTPGGDSFDWLEFPRTAQLDITHGLGRVPQGVQVWLAFGPDGTDAGLAAGELAQIAAIDENHVIVWNNTSADYWVRVVLF